MKGVILKNINEENMKLFWWWVFERQNIYYRKNIKQINPPWTNDEILRDYKFTNVYREIDRTTIWYHNNIGGSYYLTKEQNFPNKFEEIDVVFATFVHRLFNRIETMVAILPYLTIKRFNLKAVRGILDNIRNSGQNIYTSAHLVTGVRFAGSDDKLENILYLVEIIHRDINKIYKSVKNSSSLEDLYKRTTQVNGFGPFLGFQYILDMINSGICKFNHDDFVVAGPGCKRGIRHIFPDTNISFEDAMKYTRKKQHYYFDKYGYKFRFLEELGGKEVGIHLANIENCFCEFSKYYKAHHGYGRPRNKYVPYEHQQILL